MRYRGQPLNIISGYDKNFKTFGPQFEWIWDVLNEPGKHENVDRYLYRLAGAACAQINVMRGSYKPDG